MTHHLYLLRHSYAEEGSRLSDMDRNLTHAGVGKVRSLGRYLIKSDFDVSVIYCSPAIRTRQTAMHLVEELGYNESMISYENSIYGVSIRELLSLVNNMEEALTSVMIIGHNPTISYLGDYLIKGNIDFMDPCGFLHIEFEGQSWAKITQCSGTFFSYFHPDHV